MNPYLKTILTFLEVALKWAFPLKVIFAVYLPFFFSFILKVAFPLLFVLALNVFLPTFIVKVTFLIGDLPDFKVTVYFLVFAFLLNVFFLAVIFEDFLTTGFLTVTFLVIVKGSYLSSPEYVIMAL